VYEDRDTRVFVWVMDNIGNSDADTIAVKHASLGFGVANHPGKWVGPGILVQYESGKKMVPIDPKISSTVRWIGKGAGR
jgi:hypothetical protein